MFARTVALPARNGAGFVCLVCRYERGLIARHTEVQRRWNSESTGHKPPGAQEAAEALDDFLLPLNALSQDSGNKRAISESGQRRAARSTVHRNPPTEHSANENAAGGQTRKQKVQARNRPSSNIPVARGSDGRTDIPALLQSLGGVNDGASPPSRQVEDGHAALKTARTGSSTFKQASAASGNPEVQKLWDQLGPGIQEDIDALAVETSMGGREAQYDKSLEQLAAVSVPEREVKSKEPVPFPSFSPKESTATPTSPPRLFSSALNLIKKKLGLSELPQPQEVEPGKTKHIELLDSRSQGDRIANASKLESERNISVESTLNSDKFNSNYTPENSPRIANASKSEAKRELSVESVFDSIKVSSRIMPRKSPRIANASKFEAKRELSVESVFDSSAVSPRFRPKKSPAERWEESSSRQPWGGYSAPQAHYRCFSPPDGIASADPVSIKASIRKSSPEVSLTGPRLGEAVEEEEQEVRHYRRESITSAEGISLAAAMKSGSKPVDGSVALNMRAGRPAKESLPTRRKSIAAKKDDMADETAPITSPPVDSTPQPGAKDNSDPIPASSVDGFRSTTPSELHITPLDIPQPPIPYLQYGLDRVLFNPGVYQLQDQASRVYNFDPYLQNIMPNVEFDFDALKEYKTSSKDEALGKIAKEHGNKYIGSTSSMTSVLGHFHYLLSNWRPLNFGMLSNDFVGKASKPLPDQLTLINRAPAAIFLRWKNGTYAIDADKEYDGANVLMLMGKSMELLLTLPKSDFERYRKSDPRQVSDEQRTAPESYQYTTMRDLLMRSQLDAYDPRLPGNGTFDLKTRAVVSVRMAADDHEPMTGYEIYSQQGKWGSYEKEYYDMIRSTMLKYMLQARMGRMNGIFVAYHNVERIFGFQYIPIADMDRALHGQTDPTLGDQEFRASLDMLNEAFNAATAKFPEQSLRIHFETRAAGSGGAGMPAALHIFAEPMSEEECDKIQDSQKAKIAEWEKSAMKKNLADAEDAEDAIIGADELKSPDSSNEVVQDQTAMDPHYKFTNEIEEGTDNMMSSEDDACAYARSLLQSDAKGPIENSLSNADPKFLDTLAQSEELKPLFYATIITQHTVNGEIRERPQNLCPDDEWTIEYILKDYDIGRLQWAEYEDVKCRRKQAYVREEEEKGVEKEQNKFIAFLQTMSKRGRDLRKEKDEKEDGLPIVRVEELDMERLDTVESVEDYMRFLEKPKVEGTREMFG